MHLVLYLRDLQRGAKEQGGVQGRVLKEDAFRPVLSPRSRGIQIYNGIERG